MTLSIAWVRTLRSGVQELVFCSDSRLSGGSRFDHAAKLFPMPRSDCGLAFAGGTHWAYPLAMALVRATEIHFPAATRAMPLAKYKSHLVAILNQLQAAVHTYAEGENVPDATFLLGGWDFQSKAFRLWKVSFDKKEMRFFAHERKGSQNFGGMGAIEFAGDGDFIKKARAMLKEMVQQRYGRTMRGQGARWNLEPFEVLRDILLECKAEGPVGGGPQLLKVYQHMNVRIQGVRWGDGATAAVYYCGRPLLDYERAEGLWVLDPVALRTAAIPTLPSGEDPAEDDEPNV